MIKPPRSNRFAVFSHQSLNNNARCALCTTKLSTLLSYLTGPTVGNDAPTSPGTTKYLFGLDFSSHSSGKRRAILISLVSVFCFLALLIFFALWAYLRCKKRRGLLARGKETVLASGLDSMNQSTTVISTDVEGNETESRGPRCYFPNFEEPFDDVVYPKGDPDVVSLSKRDLSIADMECVVQGIIETQLPVDGWAGNSGGRQSY
ncbi:hypothetical protein Fmac_001769 [Flemingia macrophylla]|uniref:Uncharacterized protein n=1 Tax=Flemingia macrophylla TaxID=520843 RepID=A0ABD1NI12_9FABA